MELVWRPRLLPLFLENLEITNGALSLSLNSDRNKKVQIKFLFSFVKLDFFFFFLHNILVCSNNAMGLWSVIKGKGTQFRGPPAVGQVGGLFGL